jgi:replicative DNA helicase
MYSAPAEVVAVARFIEIDDLDQPASTILASIKALAGRGVPPSPQLVSDDLKRRGKLTKSAAVWLAAATCSGACSSAARNYASAVLAEVFRRQVESFGAAIVSTAASGSETDVAGLAERASAQIRYTYGRLTELRGDVDE